jgi:hypothetical protein
MRTSSSPLVKPRLEVRCEWVSGQPEVLLTTKEIVARPTRPRFRWANSFRRPRPSASDANSKPPLTFALAANDASVGKLRPSAGMQLPKDGSDATEAASSRTDLVIFYLRLAFACAELK